MFENERKLLKVVTESREHDIHSKKTLITHKLQIETIALRKSNVEFELSTLKHVVTFCVTFTAKESKRGEEKENNDFSGMVF